jgi:hypothetical protein
MLNEAEVSMNKRRAIVVRMGEKRILQGVMEKVLEQMTARTTGKNKRKGDDKWEAAGNQMAGPPRDKKSRQ